MTTSDAVREVMTQNRVTFENLLGRAEQAWRDRDTRGAAALAQAAANWAWHHHPGFFVSTRLEELLLDIGRKLFGDESRPVNSCVDVLHVLTEGYDVGGHTRLAARWITRDPRVSSVAVTQQHRVPLPAILTDAVGASGGRVIDLSDLAPDLIDRATLLRRLARDYGFIVLHIHPYDVIPLLALSSLDIPVIFINHADHVFWAGASISNIVVNFRQSGNALAIKRRGLSDNHMFLLPIPLNVTPKKRLPKREGSGTIALTIASEYKYGRGTANGYINMLLDLIRCDRTLHVVAVGPENKGLWAWANQVSGGRIQPMGIQPDISEFYQQADLYLDSFPFASVTSFLEAATYGLPIVSLRSPEASNVFNGDDPDLPAGLISVTSVPEFVDRVLHLCAHPQEARMLGQELQALLLTGRSDANWGRKLQDLYALAVSMPRLGQPRQTVALPDAVDFHLIQLQDESAIVSFDRIWLRSSETLPLSNRIKYFLAFAAEGRKVSAISLLPSRYVAVLLAWRVGFSRFRPR